MAIWRSLLCALVVTSAARAEDTSLRWQFQPGDSQNYRMTQTAKLSLQLAADSQVVTEVSRVLDFHWSVQSVDPNGKATVAVQVTALKLHVAGPGGQVADYDSQSPDEPRGFAATLAQLFKTLLDSQLEAQVNPRAEVVQLEIPEDLQTVLRSKPAGKALGQLASADDLESLARLGMPVLPDAADFAVGDEWEVEHTVETAPLGSMTAQTTYRWDASRESAGDQVARIVPQTEFRFAEPAEGEPELAAGEQSTSGEILFNLTAGRLESSSRQEKMSLSTKDGGEPTAGTLEHTLKFERMTNSE